jgi:hypothetical protein
MSDLYQISADLRASVVDLARQERPGAALTLTRSATLAITTAGTIITWQTETRNQGFTWSGTDITIPTSGYYDIGAYIVTVASITMFATLVVNSVIVMQMPASYLSSTAHGFFAVRYYTTGDVVSLRVGPSSNTTVSVNAENVASESPLIHVVQLTGVI